MNILDYASALTTEGPTTWGWDEGDLDDRHTVNVGDEMIISLSFTAAEDIWSVNCSSNDPEVLSRESVNPSTRGDRPITEARAVFQAMAPGTAYIHIFGRHENGMTADDWHVLVEVTE